MLCMTLAFELEYWIGGTSHITCANFLAYFSKYKDHSSSQYLYSFITHLTSLSQKLLSPYLMKTSVFLSLERKRQTCDVCKLERTPKATRSSRMIIFSTFWLPRTITGTSRVACTPRRSRRMQIRAYAVFYEGIKHCSAFGEPSFIYHTLLLKCLKRTQKTRYGLFCGPEKKNSHNMLSVSSLQKENGVETVVWSA